MNRLESKKTNKARRANRVRANLRGTSERPRLSVHVSNRHITAQIIDDTTSKTLASASSAALKATGTMTEKAVLVGQEAAKQAKARKIKTVSLDRGSKLYHGRVKALADAARKEGLEF